jgi:apolipoprotein N-acyltransferase
VALALLVGLAVAGDLAPDGGPGVASLRVAAVQGGGLRGLRKNEVSPASVYRAQLAATGRITAADGGRPPSLIVWPEDAVSLDEPLGQSPANTTLADLARSHQATLTVGVTETVSDTSFRNEIVAFGPDGAVVARFEKVHRVPFGEYVPDRAFFSHLADLSSVPLDAIPGHGDGVLRTPAAALGTMVSYEVFFADRGRIATRAGARLLIVPTNTSSYATDQVPSQEVAASRLQAISEGRDLVQAAPTGFSAIVDHRGRVVARSALGARQVLLAGLHLRTGATLYERFGDLPVLVGAGLLVLAGWLAAFWAPETSEPARRRRIARGRPRFRPGPRLRNR